MTNTRLNLSLPDDLLAQVDEIVERRNAAGDVRWTRTAVIRAALRAYADSEKAAR